jgi:hypothetical protein
VRRTNAQLEDVDAAIIAAVKKDHPVTLRGVYYRVVSAGAVDKTEDGYKLVGRQLLKLRRAGVIPYNWITDGTRWINRPNTWTGIDDLLDDVGASYRRALWENQTAAVMVFTEKDAISGVLLPVTRYWDVPLGVMRGYASETFCYTVAGEIIDNWKAGKSTYVYQFGDHDPSGVNAWESFADKVSGFVSDSGYLSPVEMVLGLERMGVVNFTRLAVTPEQIEGLALPTRPTKKTDTRARGFAGESVEVDAIPAPELRRVLTEAIERHVDRRSLDITRVYEKNERDTLLKLARIFNGSDDDPEP